MPLRPPHRDPRVGVLRRGPDSSAEVFAGRLLRVEVESWPAGEREIVRHPGACVVVALTSEGDVLLVRQSREAVREVLLEVPAGLFARRDESGEECAARELLEETGFRATSLQPLGRFHSSPGFTDEALELFVARAEPEGEPEEGIEVVRVPFEEAVRAARDGRIVDAKSALAMLLGRDALDGPPGGWPDVSERAS